MAVDFIQKNRKQKYLLFIVLGLAVVTFIILWFGYFNKEEELPTVEGVYIEKKNEEELPTVEGVYIEKKNVKINYELLENPLLKELVPFESAPSYDGNLGRENPFVKP